MILLVNHLFSLTLNIKAFISSLSTFYSIFLFRVLFYYLLFFFEVRAFIFWNFLIFLLAFVFFNYMGNLLFKWLIVIYKKLIVEVYQIRASNISFSMKFEIWFYILLCFFSATLFIILDNIRIQSDRAKLAHIHWINNIILKFINSRLL